MLTRKAVGLGALARGSVWTVLGPLTRGQQSVVTSTSLHSKVLSLALDFNQLYAAGNDGER